MFTFNTKFVIAQFRRFGGVVVAGLLRTTRRARIVRSAVLALHSCIETFDEITLNQNYYILFHRLLLCSTETFFVATDSVITYGRAFATSIWRRRRERYTLARTPRAPCTGIRNRRPGRRRKCRRCTSRCSCLRRLGSDTPWTSPTSWVGYTRALPTVYDTCVAHKRPINTFSTNQSQRSV